MYSDNRASIRARKSVIKINIDHWSLRLLQSRILFITVNRTQDWGRICIAWRWRGCRSGLAALTLRHADHKCRERCNWVPLNRNHIMLMAVWFRWGLLEIVEPVVLVVEVALWFIAEPVHAVLLIPVKYASSKDYIHYVEHPSQYPYPRIAKGQRHAYNIDCRCGFGSGERNRALPNWTDRYGCVGDKVTAKNMKW